MLYFVVLYCFTLLNHYFFLHLYMISKFNILHKACKMCIVWTFVPYFCPVPSRCSIPCVVVFNSCWKWSLWLRVRLPRSGHIWILSWPCGISSFLKPVGLTVDLMRPTSADIPAFFGVTCLFNNNLRDGSASGYTYTFSECRLSPLKVWSVNLWKFQFNFRLEALTIRPTAVELESMEILEKRNWKEIWKYVKRKYVCLRHSVDCC